MTFLGCGRDREDRRADVADVLVEKVVSTEPALNADEVLRSFWWEMNNSPALSWPPASRPSV
jgi:hypothetical protein